MNDQLIVDELDRVAASQELGPVDAQALIARGTRARRVRAVLTGAGGVAATAAAVALAVGLHGLGDPAGEPDGVVPAPAAAPGDPVAGPGGAADGYSDLVTSVRGRGHVTVTGFGWPTQGMEPVSSPAGEVAFPDLSEADATAACLPMLNTAAAAVPDQAWSHSGSGVDELPSRATLVSTFEAEHAGVTYLAECALPGDYVAAARPDLSVSPLRDDSAVLAACSYLAHVDLTGWTVAQRSDLGFMEVAALVSSDGHFARCVLSSDPKQRSVQLVQAPIADVPADELGTVVYSGYADTLVVAGAVGADVTDVEVGIGPGGPTRVAVTDGTFAMALAADGRQPPPDAAILALGADGDVLDQATFGQTPPEGGPVSAGCFTPVEQGSDGC
jgi:hypothetical protein